MPGGITYVSFGGKCMEEGMEESMLGVPDLSRGIKKVKKEEPKVEAKPVRPMLEIVKEEGKQYRGRKEFIAHLEGKSLSKAQAILAACYECMGWYMDGVEDCQMKSCPLHPYMPYNKDKTKRRTLSPDHVAKMKAGKEKKDDSH